MINALILFAGIVAFAWGIWLLDWIARRRDKRSHQKRA